MATPTTSIKLKGPIFDTPTQISLGFQAAVNRGITDLAQFEGANNVKEQLKPGHGRVIGKLRGQIGASLVRDNLAQFDAGEGLYGTNLVYANWVEGIDERNRPKEDGGFPGWHMFAKAHEHIDNNPKLYEQYIGDAIIEALE
jgi:hypothetical protein